MQSCIAIDDDPLMLHNYEMILSSINWINLVGTFTSPVKAAASIITLQPDIIFLDLYMPHVEGYALLDWIQPRLKEMNYTPKIIIVSADPTVTIENENLVVGQLDKSVFVSSADLEMKLKGFLNRS